VPYVRSLLEPLEGPVVAATDYMRTVPDQVRQWIARPYLTLGTDGFGRSDTRENLRRFFEIDAECTVIATLYSLAKKGQIEMGVVAQAIKDLKVDPEKVYPLTV
jgi:pyruvate dehydrogenase E1 component